MLLCNTFTYRYHCMAYSHSYLSPSHKVILYIQVDRGSEIQHHLPQGHTYHQSDMSFLENIRGILKCVINTVG